jgi:NAD+ synthase (glutamine-hydrolysing)
MRLALAQLNPVVGDIAGNAAALRSAYAAAVAEGADVVVAGELALSGYPPEDLLLKSSFVRAGTEALTALAADTGPVPLVLGIVEALDPAALRRAAWHPVASMGAEARPLANSAAVLRSGDVEAVYRKRRLPNYGVFDEARYFRSGTEPLVVDVAGTPVGVTVCEDLWGEGGPVQEAADAGAAVVLNLNASPYERGKRAGREHWAQHHAAAGGVIVAYVNQVGGQDEVVFDGDSFVMGADGVVAARGAQFATDLLLVDIDPSAGPTAAAITQHAGDDAPRLDAVAEVYAALVLGTRDYVAKNGFEGALVGVSGGIDSALVAALAADALGGARVTGVAMPSPWSSAGSLDDAEALCANLGMPYLELPIAPAMKAFDEILTEPFGGTEPGVAEENLQSRIRGTLLMALSNKRGDMLFATGNKSEYAVGYSTLYGDMAGGFAIIKDVPKLLVYELCEHRNAVAGTDLIPRATIDKPPSAELRPGQVDTDSLPPYEVLDPILAAYVELNRSVAEIVRDGFDEGTVLRIAALVDRAEYKRRQAAPGVKITARAFGKDRRLPITQRWSG